MTTAELAELLALRDTLRAIASRLDALTKPAALLVDPRPAHAHELQTLQCSGEGGRTHPLTFTVPVTGNATLAVIPPRAAFPVQDGAVPVLRGETCTVYIRERGGYQGEVLVLCLFGSRNDGPLFSGEESQENERKEGRR